MPAPRGRVDVDDVDAGAVARDDAAAREGVDGLRADARVLRDDRVGVAAALDDLVLALALRGDQREAGLLDDRALDVDVAEVVVGDEDGSFRSPWRLPFVVSRSVRVRAAGRAGARGPGTSPRRSMQPPVSSCPTVCAVDLLPRRLVLELRRRQRLALRAAISSSESSTSTRALPRSTRIRSPVRRMARLPPAAASGAAFRIDGESAVPLWRPSPIVGSDVMPRLSSARAAAC